MVNCIQQVFQKSLDRVNLEALENVCYVYNLFMNILS